MLRWFKTKSAKTKTLGQLGEEFAQEEYKKRGYKIIAANFFNTKGLRLGEVDFIAKNKSSIIFVEVKTRSSQEGRFGTAADAVNVFKQQKLLKAVHMYLAKNPELRELVPQIDVCVVLLSGVDNRPESVTIIPNAVEDSH